MAKEQLNARISALTRRQLDELGGQWGTSQTETLAVIIDRMYQQESAMNIRKETTLAPDFKSLDWQKAVATMTPKDAVRQLAKEITALVEEMYENTVTPQHKSRQAELMHNAFVSRAYPQLTGSNYSLFYRDVAIEMYNFRPLHENVLQ